MPTFVQNYTASQLSTSLTGLILNDTSTGTDSNITQRRVYVTKVDGTTLVPTGTSTTYFSWPLPLSTPITASVLNTDYALSITVQWLDVSNTVLYTKTILWLFSGYNETFDWGLVKQMATTPNLLNQAVWYQNKMKFRVLLDSAGTAVTSGNDQNAAQFCLDTASYMRNNSTKYF